MLIDDNPIGVALNRNLGSPVAPREAVEAELTRLIERRSRQKDPDDEHELWKASVRRYNLMRSEERKAQWHEYHASQAARLRVLMDALIARHEREAERLMSRDSHEQNERKEA